MSTYFISDLHFGHENMAIKRGFSCADEMNEYIIKSWNSVVHKKDTVYCLGDITMESATFYPLISRLNGYINVILGNHDRRQHTFKLLEYVNSVTGMINYKKEFILTHCPIHPCELEYRFKHNIHGHVHENSLDDNRYINVSCEVINYTPKTLEELLNE